MKIKALERAPEAPGKSTRISRNIALHPFEKAREYTRALNATKLDRVFAQPFLCSLGRGHQDGVYRLANEIGSLERLASGSGDGVVKVWDLSSREEVWQQQAHRGMVRGMAWNHDRKLLSCGTDQTIKIFDPYAESSSLLATWIGKDAYTSISHHRNEPSFAVSSSSGIGIYDSTRPSAPPSMKLQWPTSFDTITSISFNQIETSILVSCASDRSIVLYDLRTASPISKTTLTLSCNALSWNPMEAMNFAAASEDHNIYIFDMRSMKRAGNVLKDHVAAVMDVQWSPTGQELVSASYDRSIRLWSRDRGHSRDIYHTKRMQRVMSAVWTPDNNYVLSGSDDGNIRLWRAYASKRQGVKSYAERNAQEYNDVLKQRYGHMPEIRRIARHRHVPKVVKKAAAIKGEEVKAIKRREENVRKHTKKGETKRASEREKMVLGVEE